MNENEIIFMGGFTEWFQCRISSWNKTRHTIIIIIAIIIDATDSIEFQEESIWALDFLYKCFWAHLLYLFAWVITTCLLLIFCVTFGLKQINCMYNNNNFQQKVGKQRIICQDQCKSMLFYKRFSRQQSLLLCLTYSFEFS